jgi:hypothetical protein
MVRRGWACENQNCRPANGLASLTGAVAAGAPAVEVEQEAHAVAAMFVDERVVVAVIAGLTMRARCPDARLGKRGGPPDAIRRNGVEAVLVGVVATAVWLTRLISQPCRRRQSLLQFQRHRAAAS